MPAVKFARKRPILQPNNTGRQEAMRLDLDAFLARLPESERYAMLEQFWLWGSTAAIVGAILIATALWQLLR
ncbi:MAG: hypothetical protein N3B17_02880 [Chlorobi bacterium]|jgi:hypothetical protein|nr:hypothetical protein [Chlorobiota bacterium]